MKFATHNDKPHPVHEKSRLSSSSILENQNQHISKSKINKLKNKHNESIKICSRCNRYFDIDESSHGRILGSSPLCNSCKSKGLKPLGHPPHWVWNKMSMDEKTKALKKADVSILKTPNAIKIYAHDDFDDLPYKVRQKLRKEWGIEEER